MRRYLPLLFLAACATTGPDLASEKQSWQGATYDEVVARWGTPQTGERRSDGLEARTWVSEGTPFRPGPSVGIGGFGGSRGSGVGVGINLPIGGGAPTERCERTLYFRDAVVVDQQWVGPSDFCAGFRRM